MINLNESTKRSQTAGGNSGVLSFLRDLDRIQEQQLTYAKKLDKEQKRKVALDENIEIARQEALQLQEKTRGGAVVKEDEMNFRRIVSRLENNLQMARIKLSVSHSDNVASRARIDALRQDKTMYLQIQQGIEKDIADLKKRLADYHHELVVANEKKHRVKLHKSNITHQMMNEMDEFARELQAAKQNISATQEIMIGTIRERMLSTYSAWENDMASPKYTRYLSSPASQEKASTGVENTTNADIQYLLSATESKSVTEILSNLQASEEQIFGLYKVIQNLNEELEKVEMENRHLEAEADDQMNKLETLEGTNDKVNHELEMHINQIQKSIAIQEKGYNENMQVLGTISESLYNILKNVASDEDAVDQQLLSGGINDRNIQTYLGVVEQRIDDLIQMSKAALREPINIEDFVHPTDPKTGFGSSNQILQPPNLPSLDALDDNDDDNDEMLTSNTKVVPISISMLKEFMQKRIQKGLDKNNPPSGRRTTGSS